EQSEHRIRCSIISLQGAATAAGYPSSSSSSTAAMENKSGDGGRQRSIRSGRSQQRTARSDGQ
ncbi:hypothetical protein ACLOJK_040909, partial [Asimina triloba]